MLKSLLTVFAAAFAFGLSALFFCLLIETVWGSPADAMKLVRSSTAATSLTTFLLWSGKHLVRRKVSVVDGAICGALIGLASHPLTWIFYFALASGETVPTDEPAIATWWAVLIFSIFSVAAYGWLTIPLGSAAGALFSALALRLCPDKHSSG